MPVLVLARVAKGKIPVWAPTGYAHTGIGNRSVPVLALHDPYQYWHAYKNARIGILGTSGRRKNTSMGTDWVCPY
jgi:hypothetical protein